MNINTTKINLPNVTIICVDCVNPSNAVKALLYSMKGIKFAKAMLFSHYKPDNITPDIEFIEIEKLTHDTWSPFMLSKLNLYIQTDFCLSINDDGFVINPHLWDSKFLEYDYIGAPWSKEHMHRVGNGGFCLKSKRFIQLCRHIPWRTGLHDDILTCITYHDFFVQNGCTFAPLEVAMKFSLETKISECEYNLNNCFGFHGRGTVEYLFQDGGQQFKDKISLLNTI